MDAEINALTNDLENYPTWEKIADVHRKASEARLEVIKSQAAEIATLKTQLEVLKNTLEIIGTINKY